MKKNTRSSVLKNVDITQAQLASLLDCSQASVSHWMKGNSPSDENMYKIKGIIKYLKTLMQQSVRKQEQCEKIRREFGRTGQDIASFLGVTPSTIYRWEKGELPRDSNPIKMGVISLKCMLPSKRSSTEAA